VLVSTVVFAVFWTFLFLRIRREPDVRTVPAPAPVEVVVP
jgi:hypothetical protein